MIMSGRQLIVDVLSASFFAYMIIEMCGIADTETIKERHFELPAGKKQRIYSKHPPGWSDWSGKIQRF